MPDGDYRPRVRLADAHKTITFPNEMRVDTERPRVERFSVSRRVVSPDGDGRADGVSVSYRLSERGRVRLLVNGKTRVRKRGQAPNGAVQWFGKFRGPLGAARASTGSSSSPSTTPAIAPSALSAGPVRVRYIELGLDSIGSARARASACGSAPTPAATAGCSPAAAEPRRPGTWSCARR